MVGCLTMENELLKKLCSGSTLSPTERQPMERSNVYSRGPPSKSKHTTLVHYAAFNFSAAINAATAPSTSGA